MPDKKSKTMKKEDLIKILEDMPLGLRCQLKIGENEYALKMVKKTHKNATMESLKQYNCEARKWDEGYAAAINDIKEWRNKQYLKLKNLN